MINFTCDAQISSNSNSIIIYLIEAAIYYFFTPCNMRKVLGSILSCIIDLILDRMDFVAMDLVSPLGGAQD